MGTSVMKLKFSLAVLALLVISGCRTVRPLTAVHIQENISINANLPEDPEFVKVIAPYKKELESKMNTKISYTSVDLTKQGDNSNLGNLLADFTLQGAEEWAKKNGKYSVDAAVINVGGIRSMIGKGDILTRHIYEVMPFENEIVIVKMSGKQLQGLYDYYIATQKNNPVAGLHIETNAGKPVKFQIGGKPVVPNQIYYIATSDYLSTGGDQMDFFKSGEIISTGIKMRDLFLEKFAAVPQIQVPSDIRLIFKNKPNKSNE